MLIRERQAVDFINSIPLAGRFLRGVGKTAQLADALTTLDEMAKGPFVGTGGDKLALVPFEKELRAEFDSRVEITLGRSARVVGMFTDKDLTRILDGTIRDVVSGKLGRGEINQDRARALLRNYNISRLASDAKSAQAAQEEALRRQLEELREFFRR